MNKVNDHTWRPQLRCNDNYTFTCPGWNTYPTSDNVDDMQWHKMELYIDVGTSGDNNAHLWIKIDGDMISELSSFSLTQSGNISSNPIDFLQGWPSNVGGTDAVIQQRTWLDDLEIYILDGPDDIPPELSTYATADVNQNGSVNVQDMQLVVNVILGSAENERADVDGNGEVNVQDVQAVVNEVVG